jgi:hypothetical protein
VIEAVTLLQERGVKSGVNLLVRRSRLEEAHAAAEKLRSAGIENDRIVYLPIRGSRAGGHYSDTPSAEQVALVAGSTKRFQSMTCLTACGKSPRFASIDSNQYAAWCSYTRSRRKLRELTFSGLLEALDRLEIEPCANDNINNNNNKNKTSLPLVL